MENCAKMNPSSSQQQPQQFPNGQEPDQSELQSMVNDLRRELAEKLVKRDDLMQRAASQRAQHASFKIRIGLIKRK